MKQGDRNGSKYKNELKVTKLLSEKDFKILKNSSKAV